MKLSLQLPKKSLNRAVLKYRPLKFQIDQFKNNLLKLLGKIDEIEREENQKNHIRDFLRDTYYKDVYEINTKDVKDLVIHTGKTNKDNVGVIIEAKRPSNKSEMITADKLNCKAFQELVLYFLDERIDKGNTDIKYCIATNVYEWFIFDAFYFEKYFYRNKNFVKEYDQWKTGQKVAADKELFYNDIAKPYIDSNEDEIPVVYIDLRAFEKDLKVSNPESEKNLLTLFKLFSPHHLLRISFPDDSNKLDQKFYKELLHIIGLEEVKEGSKHIIRRKEKAKRDAGSLLENAISKLEVLDSIDRVSDSINYGDTKDEKNFNIALELCITWINRILFLKLLEAQLVNYHSGDYNYKFLNKEKLKDFDEVFSLFHHVLAVPAEERTRDVKLKFHLVPYLNSTLFEVSQLEKETISVANLNDSLTLDLINISILQDSKKSKKNFPTLDYILKFLDAYDFSSEGGGDTQDESRTLINASVLGKVFEKINGYKDGSIFTPGFITMYMCREAIRPAVVQKFKDKYNWNIEHFDDLRNFIADKRNREDIGEFNSLIDSIKICDPAVGSGHFLVSALNEIIAIKSELGIFADEYGVRLSDYDISVEQDELVITDKNGDIFDYKVKSSISGKEFKVRPDIQKLQRTLFHEKQKLIENCLFGVDINPNSVKICRLRLWIELLKNAYYRPPSGSLQKEGEVSSELETLPNIDINIKNGNSLISRFPLDANLSKFGQKIKDTIEEYRVSVRDYKNEKDRAKKNKINELIARLKNDIRSTISKNDPKLLRLMKLKGELENIETQTGLFEQTKKELKEKEANKKKLISEITKLNKEIEDIKSNAIYRNAFEWRFEFPEVLNSEGEYMGFDVVIGNPPYIVSREKFSKSLKEYLNNSFKYIHEKPNLYLLFLELSKYILKINGEVAFVIPNSFTGVESAYKLRQELITNNNIHSIINILGETFKTVGVESCILFFSKSKPADTIKFLSTSKDLIDDKEFKFVTRYNWMNNRNFLFDISSSNRESMIINNIKSNSLKLFEKYDVRVGLQAYEKNKGLPKQSAEDVKNHIFDYNFKFDEKTYPYLTGSDVSRYSYNWSGQWLRYGEWLSQPKKFDQFSLPRLLIREITSPFPKILNATYISEVYLNNKSILNVLEKDKNYNLKFLLSVLNSKLLSFYHVRQTVKGNRKLFPKIVTKDLKNYPIPKIELLDQSPFIVLVDKILEFKKKAKDTKALEDEIDRMVYELYGLTEEEIEIVEGIDEK